MRETKSLALSLKEIDERGVFTGCLSKYGVLDLDGDVVVQGAFTKSLAKNGNRFPLLWKHEDPIGTFEAADHAEGLYIKGTLLPIDEVPLAKYAYLCLKKEAVSSLSIGYRIPEKGMEHKDGVRYLKELNLFEGSLVAVPANPEARITAVKGTMFDMIEEYNKTASATSATSKAGRRTSKQDEATIRAAIEQLTALLPPPETEDDEESLAKFQSTILGAL